MADHVLDLIDNVVAEHELLSADAMRWAPDAPDPTPAGFPTPRLLVPVVTDADLAAMRQAADTAGWFMRAIPAQLEIVDAYESARAATAAIGGTATYTAEVFAYEQVVRALARGLGINPPEETP